MASEKFKDGVPAVLILPTSDGGAVGIIGTFHESASETGKSRYKGKTVMVDGVRVEPAPEPERRVETDQQKLFPWLKIPGAKKEYVN